MNGRNVNGGADVEPSPWRGEFPPGGAIYLNHAGVAPIPARAGRAVESLVREMVSPGATRYPAWEAAWEESRRRCAALLEVSPRQVAFVPNTSTALSMVALGLDWRVGDGIVTTDQEFPSNAVIWMETARRHGLELHRVGAAEDGSVAASALLSRVDDRTRVVAVSSVQYASGAAVDLRALGEGLRGTDTLLVVDAIQSLGVLPLHPEALGVDVVAADGHKWLLGPEGCGIFYLSEKAMEWIQPRLLGWHSVANAGEYDRIVLEWRGGAKRFEPGSPNFLGAAALGESAGLLLEAGLNSGAVAARVRGVVGGMMAGLVELGCRLHTPLAEDGVPAAGILVFSHPAVENRVMHQRLREMGVYHAQRGRGLRLSPHFYQDGREVKAVLERVERAIKGEV
ncbi:MAG: aminotransferase class V-fold PLP-dependent enzyme [Magnetococcales bacterium]|nr:aminotransferase class V-fold PLP-dependent enzyme [Magnetococcales bacterium]